MIAVGASCGDVVVLFFELKSGFFKEGNKIFACCGRSGKSGRLNSDSVNDVFQLLRVLDVKVVNVGRGTNSGKGSDNVSQVIEGIILRAPSLISFSPGAVVLLSSLSEMG